MTRVTNDFANTTYNKVETPQPFAKGKLSNSREATYLPASHKEIDDVVKIVAIVAVVVFLVSILFWAIGASTNVAALELIGKIFFGLSMVVISLAVAAACCGVGAFACSKLFGGG